MVTLGCRYCCKQTKMKVIVFVLCVALAGPSLAVVNNIGMDILSAQLREVYGIDAARYGAAENIPELAKDLKLTSLVEFLGDTGLDKALAAEGNFTVFGPNNAGFDAIQRPFFKILMNNKTLLAEILKYHVAKKEVFYNQLSNEMLIESILGPEYAIRINFYKNNTVVTASGREVVKVDQKASNGVIHVLNTVMYPPPGNMIWVLEEYPIFSYLWKAVKVLGLVDAWRDTKPFTLFAPSNMAFNAIPKLCRHKLFVDTSTLRSVILNHVVEGTVFTAGLSNGDKLKSASGNYLHIHKEKGSNLRVNWVKVTIPDVTVTNGVHHAIDRILFPGSLEKYCDGDTDSMNERPLVY